MIAVTLSSASAEYLSRTVTEKGGFKGLHYYSLNPDCSLAGYPTVRITAEPSNGRPSVSKGTGFPNYSAADLRSACNTRRVPAVIINYQPNHGFVGSDSFNYEVFFSDGSTRSDSVNITVK